MKILEEPHQDPQRSLCRSLKILKDLKKIFTSEKGEKNWVWDAKVKINKMAEKAEVQLKKK